MPLTGNGRSGVLMPYGRGPRILETVDEVRHDLNQSEMVVVIKEIQ